MMEGEMRGLVKGENEWEVKRKEVVFSMEGEQRRGCSPLFIPGYRGCVMMCQDIARQSVTRIISVLNRCV